jgi:hypothetical protein
MILIRGARRRCNLFAVAMSISQPSFSGPKQFPKGHFLLSYSPRHELGGSAQALPADKPGMRK